MADRYQDKPFPADDDYDRGSPHVPAKGESDPLAELARLIGQTDPFSNFGRANQPMPPRENDRYRQSEPEPDIDDGPAAGPPPWMQRAAQQEAPPQLDFDNSVHPLRRYAAAHPAAAPDDHEAPPFAAPDQHLQADPARYDDALYGEPDPGTYADPRQEAAYADDPYAYQDGYDEETEDKPSRRGGLVTVVAVLALAVIGTGGAFAYRTYVGSPRSGEPPVIKADAGPTKIVPAPSGDGVAKVADRMTPGGGAEKIVPREEAPVDVNAQGQRVVFPPLNQNTSPPSAASVAPGAKPAAAPAANGTLAVDEPRKVKIVPVKGDPADVAATPAPKPAAAPRPVPAPTAAARAPSPAANANASANAPLSLSPQGAQPAPADTRPHVANAVQPAPSGGGSYVVQVSSQRNEADAQASYRVMQGKFPSVLGSRAPLIKRADLGEKGVYYRAMVGPFASSEEAAQLCGSLKTAGGQCVVQKN
jgi:SPOR domain